MRILYHHRTQGEEPESIHISAIVNALIELGHDVQVVGPVAIPHQTAKSKSSSLLGKIKKKCPRMMVEIMQLAYNLVAYRRLAIAVQAFKPDLIYERYALFSFVGVSYARKKGIPLILEVNTPYAQAWSQYYGLYLKRLANWLEKVTLLRASHIVTVTEAQRQMLTKLGIPLQQLSVCHNAIDPEWFCVERHHRADLKASLGLNSIVIGFVGTMNRWQGIDSFKEVVKDVLGQCAGANFLFVGDGEFRPSLEGFCHTHGYSDRVFFTGLKPHSEVPSLVAIMDIAVLLNSNSYGSPMKIFEYFGMGKPVIAPSVGPVQELMRHEENGLLIEPGNAKQMAAQIIRLVNDPELRDRLGKAGKEYVIANHTWRQNALKIEEIHKRLIFKDSAGSKVQIC